MLCLGTGDARLHELVGDAGFEPAVPGGGRFTVCWSSTRPYLPNLEEGDGLEPPISSVAHWCIDFATLPRN